MAGGQTGYQGIAVRHVVTDFFGRLVNAIALHQPMEEKIARGSIATYKSVTRDAVQV